MDVKSEFHGKLPRIDFVDEHTQLRIQLSTGNELAIMTSRLLLFYAMLDERVKQVCCRWSRFARFVRKQSFVEVSPHSLSFRTKLCVSHCFYTNRGLVRPFSIVEDIAIRSGPWVREILGFDSRAGQIEHSVANGSPPLCWLSRGDGPRQSLHLST